MLPPFHTHKKKTKRKMSASIKMRRKREQRQKKRIFTLNTFTPDATYTVVWHPLLATVSVSVTLALDVPKADALSLSTMDDLTRGD